MNENENDTGEINKFVRYALASYNRRGHTGGIISGEFAKGKTVTAIKLAGKILQAMYGYTKEQAWDVVIEKHMIFTADEFIGLTETYEEYDWENMDYKEVLKTKFNIRYPVLIWDDAGIHASSKKERFEPGDSWEIQTEYDTIRDITSCMLLTVPEEGELMKFLRSYRSNYFIELAYPVKGGNYNDRILHFYKYGRDKQTGNMKRKLKWTQNKPFSIHLDDYYYGKYDKKRTIAKLKHNKRLKQKKEEREIIKKYRLLKKKHLIDKWSKEINKMESGDEDDISEEHYS